MKSEKWNIWNNHKVQITYIYKKEWIYKYELICKYIIRYQYEYEYIYHRYENGKYKIKKI